MFGLGATLSNYLGQMVVEQFGHVASLTGSLIISVIPLVIFGIFMPETLGDRGQPSPHSQTTSASSVTAEMDPLKEKPVAATNYVEMD
jgi:hypothetical protein